MWDNSARHLRNMTQMGAARVSVDVVGADTVTSTVGSRNYGVVDALVIL